MKISYRLAMMFLSLAIILGIGWVQARNFQFATGQFWFISGALLLVMLSTVDQPHFSKDANVFANGATALVSLLSIPDAQREGIWSIFFLWSIFIIVVSLALMMLRSRELSLETKKMQFFSRLNRTIGRPESIFSALFLWGVFLQFSYPDDGVTINALLLFWAVFMILNVPAIALTISGHFSGVRDTEVSLGVVTGVQSPRLAVVRLSPSLSDRIVGRKAFLTFSDGEKIAEGTLFEDRIVKGVRQGRVALSSFGPKWAEVSGDRRIEVSFPDVPNAVEPPVGVVSAGSTIGRLVFEVDPRTMLHEGEVVKVESDAVTYYQIVAAIIDQTGLEDGNASQSVRVSAGQLGAWENEKAGFSPIDWVAPAGEVVVVSAGENVRDHLPDGRSLVGYVPNSDFPVHVHVSDTITHNTALIGVTGSGKSYLAFHLIESYLDAGIKVLILDLTRQHFQFLGHRDPTALREAASVEAWLNSDSSLGIHQFANAKGGFPRATADFIEECFKWLQGNTALQAGVDVPARLCIVIEEAHSLIPEWNQVAQDSDKQQVNRSARVILQGRKFGLGSLLISQRTANVTKTILNQCNTIFALRSFDQTGLDFLRNYMGEEYSQAISTLPDRTAILVGKASSSTHPIIFKISDFAVRWTGNNRQPPAEESPVAI